MGHIERRLREKEKIKKNILDAALNVAISDGWNAVTIRKIANDIEYTPPIVYEYFRNKEDLLNELVLLGHRMLAKGNMSSIKKESDPGKIVMALSENFWDFAFRHKELYQLMFSLNKKIPEKEVYTLIQTIIEIFVQLVGNEKMAKEAMFSWMCFLQGYIYNVKQMGLPPDLSTEDPRELFIRAMSKYISNL